MPPRGLCAESARKESRDGSPVHTPGRAARGLSVPRRTIRRPRLALQIWKAARSPPSAADSPPAGSSASTTTTQTSPATRPSPAGTCASTSTGGSGPPAGRRLRDYRRVGRRQLLRPLDRPARPAILRDVHVPHHQRRRRPALDQARPNSGSWVELVNNWNPHAVEENVRTLRDDRRADLRRADRVLRARRRRPRPSSPGRARARRKR